MQNCLGVLFSLGVSLGLGLGISLGLGGSLVACGNEGANEGTSDAVPSTPPGSFGGTCVPSASLHTRDLGKSCQISYGGRGTGLSVRAIGLLSVRLADSGELPRIGGVSHGSVFGVGVLGLVQVNEIYGIVKSEGAASVAAATVSGLRVGIAGISITAGALESSARATCDGVTGGSRVAGLSINGLAANVTGEPNQTIDLGVAKIVLNEQVIAGKAIVVHALHILAAELAEISLATSRASVDCPCGRDSKGTDTPPTELPPATPPDAGPSDFGVLGDACDDKNPCADGHRCEAVPPAPVH